MTLSLRLAAAVVFGRSGCAMPQLLAQLHVHMWVKCLDDGNRRGVLQTRRGPVGGCAGRDARQND
eukprot:72340-Chlamydomonas_euryale.AAC.1